MVKGRNTTLVAVRMPDKMAETVKRLAADNKMSTNEYLIRVLNNAVMRKR